MKAQVLLKLGRTDAAVVEVEYENYFYFFPNFHSVNYVLSQQPININIIRTIEIADY